MKLCILSDSHDHRSLLAAAAAEAKRDGAEAVIHCGDLIAPSTIHAITPLGLPIHLVHGNNQGDLYHLQRLAHDPKHRLQYYGQDGAVTLGGRRIFIVHYPHYAKAMAVTGHYDLVCNGHEHRAIVEHVTNIRGGETVRVDPGTVAGIGAPPTYVFADLARMEFEIRPVPELELKEPRKVFGGA
jgi:uncharacterized protein